MDKKELAAKAVELLKKEYPDALCSLTYTKPHELLFATRLAAQCTDARVNIVAPVLYEKYPTIEALAEAPVEEIEEIVRPCGLGPSKARDISKCMKMLHYEYHDEVPDTMEVARLDALEREIMAKVQCDCGVILTGIHQPHPVSSGWGLMATPEGRHKGKPISVTLTPESGTMKNGATAALKSASVFDSSLIQWNFCVMVNYYASVFDGNEGYEVFKKLLNAYFAAGGMQHQPNVMDAEQLRRAQEDPEQYKDLIVRLWGVSAHFVDLPRELQDEMIARLG